MKSSQFAKQYLYEGLDKESYTRVRLWESVGQLLKEANLTADQIQQVFAAAEQGATAAGGNRTLLGQGADAAAAVNKAWEELKTKIQSSAPIQNVDAAYDDAVAKIEKGLGGPDNKVTQAIQKYRDFAQKHPVAQSFIYAALIAAAGISGAGLGGAAVLGLLKMTDKLLQGEKFSSAAYAGAKTGATAYAAGQIGQSMQGGDAAAAQPDAGYQVGTGGPADIGNQSFAAPANTPTIDAGTVDTATQSAQAGAKDAAATAAQRAATASNNASGAADTAQAAGEVAKEVVKGSGAEMFGLANDQLASPALNKIADRLASGLPLNDNQMDFLQKVSDGAVRMVDMTNVPGSINVGLPNAVINAGGTQLTGDAAARAAWSHWQNIQDMMKTALENSAKVTNEYRNPYIDHKLGLMEFALNRRLRQPTTCFYLTPIGVRKVFAEGAGWDAIKAGAGQIGQGIKQGVKNVAGAAAQKVATAGKNLTTKVTADKLTKAWTKAGSPLDSDSISKIMTDAGLAPEVVSQAFASIGVNTGTAAPAATPAAPEAPTATPAEPTAATPAAPEAPTATPAEPAAAPAPATPAAAQPAAAQPAAAQPAAPAAPKPNYGGGQQTVTPTLKQPAAAQPAAPAAPKPNYGAAPGGYSSQTIKMKTPVAAESKHSLSAQLAKEFKQFKQRPR